VAGIHAMIDQSESFWWSKVEYYTKVKKYKVPFRLLEKIFIFQINAVILNFMEKKKRFLK